jgi:predicted dehydrogenase
MCGNRQYPKPQTSDRVRIGVVGVGNFGRLHALTLAGLAEAELVAVVDDRESALNAIGEELPGVPAWVNLQDALQKAGAEAWVIATPTRSHVPLARHILSSGGTVLIEKPLAESLDAAQELEPLVSADPDNVMLGHILLFAPEFRQLAQEVRRRGSPIYFHAVRHRPSHLADLYRETTLRLLMVHDLYLALVLMNGEEPLRTSARLHLGATERCDLVLAEMEWAGGTWGSFTASFLTPPGMPPDGFDRLEVFGDGWAAQLRLNPQPLEVWAERAEWPLALDIHADPGAPSGWLAEELRHFCRVVRGRARVPPGARYADGLRIQSWLERMEAPVEAGG